MYRRRTKKVGGVVGNKTAPSFSYVGLDIDNEFNKKGKGKSAGVMKLDKKIVSNEKKYFKKNPLDILQKREFEEQAKVPSFPVVAPKKVGGGRNAYISKLKDIMKKKNCSLKEAMKYYKENK